MRALAPLFALLLLTACGLLDGDDDPPPPVGSDPALAPAPTEPVTETPRSDTNGTSNGTAGTSNNTIRIPGLGDLPIPLPLPGTQTPHSDPEPPARGSLAAAPPGSFDASGQMTRAFVESEAEVVHQALVAALATHEREQVQSVPFEVVRQDQPNAAAGCTRSDRHPVMMITSSMLELIAGISETKAYDEVANTTTYETYVAAVVQQIRQGQAVQGVAPGQHVAPHATDAHKLARQRHLFDQQVAFVLGHELAHHYLGHTNCVEGRSDAEIQRDELAAMLSHTVPPFEQPREVEADMWGVVNALEAGHERAGGAWTEEGALLNLDFFRRLSDRGGAELVMAFLSTHPPSVIRIPIVRSTAGQWTPGFRPLRMPSPGGDNGGLRIPAGLPIPQGLPIPRNLPIPLPLPFPGAGGGNNGTGN